MRQLDHIRSPFGLGWARRLALANAPPGTTVRDAFDRQLLTGIITVSAATFLVGAVTAIPFGTILDVVASLVPAVVEVALLAIFLARGSRVSTFAHLFMVMLYPTPFVSAIALGGVEGWLCLGWAYTFPLTAALLTGVRGGLVWAALVLAGVCGFAVTQAVGFHPIQLPGLEQWFTPLPMTLSITSMLAFQTFILTWFIQQRDIVEELLATERQAAEGLLLNVLPASVARRLQKGEVVADNFDEVTVVFADLVGFTTLAAGLPPRRVVGMLAEVFGAVDQLATEEGMEKVKTIGDCYMAVAGAPDPVEDHADRALRFAVRVRDRLNGWNHYGTELTVRIGVHTGPAMGGILGDKRIVYDLWGDTVNTASRLESSGIPGEVQVSETTVRLLKARWPLEDRGVVQLRGRSGMRSYVVGREDTGRTRSAAEPA